MAENLAWSDLCLFGCRGDMQLLGLATWDHMWPQREAPPQKPLCTLTAGTDHIPVLHQSSPAPGLRDGEELEAGQGLTHAELCLMG